MARFFPDRPPGTRAVMARTKSRPIRLSAADRQMLTGLARTGSHPAQQVRRARILLALDENDPDRDGPVPTQAVIAEPTTAQQGILRPAASPRRPGSSPYTQP